MSINMYDEEVGLLKRGSIVGYDPVKGVLKVRLNTGQAIKGPGIPIDVPAPHSLFYNNGLFIGTLPAEKTPVVIGQGNGGQYFFVSHLSENLSAVPKLNLGELLIRSNDNTKITLDLKNNINIGSSINKVHIDAVSNLITTNFYNENHFTQASRSVVGIVKRDLAVNTNFDQDAKLENDNYDSKFKIIGMDPTTTSNSIITGSTKNPAFVENRELIYEFQNISGVDNDLNESVKYGSAVSKNPDFSFPNRRKSRADTLSLALTSPNYLMEIIKGTVVDIFGNVLDLNRAALPIGQGQNTIRSEKSTDKIKSFLLIKELERKSLAYHFEINARKDLGGISGQLSLPDINSNADYARNRSRFFIDIDKEGQFKLNVPASSEKGNVPLLTRYENYSTFGSEDNGNPNKLIFRNDGLDIFQDSFAAAKVVAVDDGFSSATDAGVTNRGSIELKSDDAIASPIDRITRSHIKHGTAYHDILNTCFTLQNNLFLDYQTGEVDPLTVTLSDIPILENIVSKTIIVSGDKANAGGRSGSLNFDGSIEMNIGANTVDRQSLWLDTAGGIIANVGKDLRDRSAVVAMDGDFLLQVGGFTVKGDSRFENVDSTVKSAVLDLRVMTGGGYCHMIRCDKNGVTIMSPGAIKMHSKGDMLFTADGNMRLECANLIIQERLVLKGPMGSI